MTETLLDQIQGSVKTTVADGAYDRAQARNAIRRRGSKALIPPPKNARYKELYDDRNDAICIIVCIIEGLGGGKEGRSLWGKLTGYSIRALVESAFSRIKRIFGDRLFSKIAAKQAIENRLKRLILNKIRK